jgi:hypothetical protein
MSVAVFITDQSKYTENFERKNIIERKKIRDQASKKARRNSSYCVLFLLPFNL